MAPYLGHCLCGNVRYRVDREPLTVHACHCTECQRGRMCAACGTRLWGTPTKRPDIRIVQPGTLEQPHGLAPALHQWVSEAQPWLALPPGVPAFDREPADARDYVRLWQQRPGERDG